MGKRLEKIAESLGFTQVSEYPNVEWKCIIPERLGKWLVDQTRVAREMS